MKTDFDIMIGENVENGLQIQVDIQIEVKRNQLTSGAME